MYEAWGLVDGSWIKGFEVGVDAKTGLTPLSFYLKIGTYKPNTGDTKCLLTMKLLQKLAPQSAPLC